MVFCNTRMNTDFVANNLKNLGVDAIAIHGGLTQEKRKKIMDRFHEKNVYVLVCTDIAARGLDIKGVSHVYNYDIPKTSQEYIHRIGRTARAGKDGIAVNILSDRDYENFTSVLRDDSLKIKEEELPKNIEMVRFIVKKPFERRNDRWDSRNWKARDAIRRSNQFRSKRSDFDEAPRHGGNRGRRDFGKRSPSGGRSYGRGRTGGGHGYGRGRSPGRDSGRGSRWSKKKY